MNNKILIIFAYLILSCTEVIYSQDFVEIIRPEITFYVDSTTIPYIGKFELQTGLIDRNEIDKVSDLVNDSYLRELFEDNEIITEFGLNRNNSLSIGVELFLKEEGYIIKAPRNGFITNIGYDELNLKRYVMFNDFTGNSIIFGNIEKVSVYPGERLEKDDEIAYLNDNSSKLYIIIKRDNIYWNPINMNELRDKIGIFEIIQAGSSFHHEENKNLYLYNSYNINESEKYDFYLKLLKKANVIYPLDNGRKQPIQEFYSRILDTNNKILGLDLPGSNGDKILAVIDGVIIRRGYDPLGFGNFIILRDSNGINYAYGHMLTVYVGEGDVIKQGDTIGLIGQTGYTTQDSLHFGIMIDDVFINPMNIY